MPRFKAHFEDGLIQIPRNSDVMDDLRAIQINHRGVPRLPDKQTGTGRHGDSAIALCLAVYATTLEGAPIEFKELPSKQSRWDFDDDNDDDLPIGDHLFQ